MRGIWKRWGALLLALVLTLTLLPAPAVAQEGQPLPAGETVPAAEDPVADGPADLFAVDPIRADDAAYDLAVSRYTLTVSSQNSADHATEGPMRYAIDNNYSTFWHSNHVDWGGENWICIELDTADWVSALRYRPRSDYTKANGGASARVNGNGYVTAYRVETSLDGETWTEAASGTWNAFEEVSGRGMLPTGAWEVANFAPVKAKYIKLVGVHTGGNEKIGDGTQAQENGYMHAAELRVAVKDPPASVASISGTVVDSSNAPLSGVTVTIGGHQVTTGADGAFSITDLPGNETYTVQAVKENYVMAAPVSIPVTEGAVTGRTITMQALSRAVLGTVTNGAGAAVTLVRAASPYETVAGYSATADESGAYTMNINSLAPGSYKIRAARKDYGAALGDTFTVPTDTPATLSLSANAALTAIDLSNVWYNFDMTEGHRPPTPEAGSANTAVRFEADALFMNFLGADQEANQARLVSARFREAAVEFDATRGGESTAGGFGVMLRRKDASNYFFVGQGDNSNTWLSKSVNAGTAAVSAGVQGPSFGKGETRHFKITLTQDGTAAKVSLWVDGIQVIADAPAGTDGSGHTDLGCLAFCGARNTSISLKNLYITRMGPDYTVTAPGTVTAYLLIGGSQEQPLGTTAHAGDVIRVYSADPALNVMNGLVVKGEGETTYPVDGLHTPTATAPNAARGKWVQFTMPEANVTLEPSFKKGINGIRVTYPDGGDKLLLSKPVSVAAMHGEEEVPEGANVTFSWYRADTADPESWGSAIARGSAYIPTQADVGKYLLVKASVSRSNSEYGGEAQQLVGALGAKVSSVTIMRAGGPDTPPLIVDVDGTAQLVVAVSPGSASNLALEWTSSDESIATVEGQTSAVKNRPSAAIANAVGTVRGVSPGTVTITVTNPDSGVSDTREVKVGTSVTNVILPDGQHSATLYTNGATSDKPNTVTLTPTVNPEGASDKTVEWWSEDEGIATVENGVVTAVATGTTRVHVRSVQNKEAAAYCDVTVVTLPKTITFTSEKGTELLATPGDALSSTTLKVTVAPADTTDPGVTWTSSDTNVVTVSKPWSSQDALAVAQGPGTATVTATSAVDESVTHSMTFTVRCRLVGALAVNGDQKLGSTLTVALNDIAEGAKGGLTYQWYRGEVDLENEADKEAKKLAGETGQSYTPVQADIGQVLTVVATADGVTYVGSLGVSTGVIGKADGLPLSPETPTHQDCSADGVDDGKITGLSCGAAHEFKLVSAGDDAWERVPAGVTEIINLAPGNYHVRHAETETHAPGAPSPTVTILSANDSPNALAINIPAMTGGRVTASTRRALAGAQVTLTVKAEDSHDYNDDLAVTKAGGAAVETLTKNSDGTYTFTMPNEAVNVSASFEQKTYEITHAMVNIICDIADDHTKRHGEPFSVTLSPAEGHDMPQALTIKDTETGERFTDFTYTAHLTDSAKRVLNFPNGVDRNITVSGEATLKAFPVSVEGDRITVTAPATANWKEELAVAIAPEAGYWLTGEITVAMAGTALPEAAYDFDPETGALLIHAGIVTGNLIITVSTDRVLTALEKVSISGVAQVGARLTANITPAEADSYVSYQWYWVSEENGETVEEAIPGAEGRTRVVTEASLGKAIRVKATAQPGGGFSGIVSSEPTGTVIAADAPTVAVGWVELSAATAELREGDTLTLVAVVGPSDATNKTITWQSGNEAVATVENGVVTAVSPGTAVITVTTEDGAHTARCTVTVREARTILASADEVTLPYDGTAHGIQVEVTRPTSDYDITYSTDGAVFSTHYPTFIAAGEYVVWYKVTAADMEPFQGQTKVTIERAQPVLTVSASATELTGAGSVTFTVSAPDYVDRDGLTIFVSDPAVTLTVDRTGTYQAQLPGTAKRYDFVAQLMGTANYTEALATCTVTVTVKAPEPPDPPTPDDPPSPPSPPSGPSGPSGGAATETWEDGTKVTTVTTPDGSKVETAVQPDGVKTQTVTDKTGAVTITATDAQGREMAKVEIPAALPTAHWRFSDVPETHWADKAIHKMAALEVVNGTGGNKYSPVAAMDRASLAAVLFRLSHGKSDVENVFEDVASGQWYAEAVTWAAEVNVVKGIRKTEFAPQQVITREQLATMLCRYAKLLGLNTAADKAGLNAFSDGANTSEWAENGMAWCVKAGVIKGKDGGRLDPTADVSRAEVAVMLERFLTLLK